MRSVSKPWPRWLLAAVTTLVLLATSIAGAYAHAVGHQLPQAVHTIDDRASAHAAHLPAMAADATAASAAGHAGGSYDRDGDHAWTEGCDTICHGGHAILTPDVPVHYPLFVVPTTVPLATFDGIEPGSLDRPPKAFRSA